MFQSDTPPAIINLIDEASDGYASHVPAGVLRHSLSFFCELPLARPSYSPPNVFTPIARVAPRPYQPGI